MGIIIALISGALMSIQGVFNTEVTKSAGLWLTNSFVQLTAFIVCLLFWIFGSRNSVMELFKVDNKFMLLGGVIGSFITYTVIKSMDSLGPAKAALIIVISQVIVAYGIELFGLFGVEKVQFEWRKLIGMATAIVGLIIFKYK